MSILVDIIILGIIALSIFIGYRRGLIKCAINVLSFFIAILVVILLTSPISNLIIKNTKIDDNIRAAISEKIDFNDVNVQEMKLSAENSNSPEVVRDHINNMVLDLTKTTTGTVTEALAENITVIIINITVAIVLFVGTKFALMFVKVLADVIGRIPFIKQFNKAGGIIYGIFSGIVRVYVILAVISIIVPVITDSSLIQAINNSILGNSMYNNNILLKIIL